MADTSPTVDDFTPEKPARTRTPKKKPERRPPTERQIRESLDQGWVAASLYVSGVRHDEYCGMIIAERGPALTEQLLELAKVNPAVKRALEAWATTGAWGGVIGGVVSMAVPIMAHHGRLHPDLAARFGAPLPEAVTSDSDEPNVSAVPDAPVVGPYGPVGMESGRTRNVDRPDGLRENDVISRDSGAA